MSADEAIKEPDWMMKIQWPADLDPTYEQKLVEILHMRHQAFAKHEDDIGRTTTVKHHIHTTDDIPVKEPYRSIPPSQFEEGKEHIVDEMRRGHSKWSTSGYGSGLVLCRKKTGKLRMCVYYCRLNKKTLKDAFPLPKIQDSLNNLHGAKYFSTIDPKSAYNEVEIAEEDEHKTAFVAPFGHNVGAMYQHLMQIVLCKETNRYLLVFLDDVVVFSKTLDEHLEPLKMALLRLEEHRLKAEPLSNVLI